MLAALAVLIYLWHIGGGGGVGVFGQYVCSHGVGVIV